MKLTLQSPVRRLTPDSLPAIPIACSSRWGIHSLRVGVLHPSFSSPAVAGRYICSAVPPARRGCLPGHVKSRSVLTWSVQGPLVVTLVSLFVQPSPSDWRRCACGTAGGSRRRSRTAIGRESPTGCSWPAVLRTSAVAVCPRLCGAGVYPPVGYHGTPGRCSSPLRRLRVPCRLAPSGLVPTGAAVRPAGIPSSPCTLRARTSPRCPPVLPGDVVG